MSQLQSVNSKYGRGIYIILVAFIVLISGLVYLSRPQANEPVPISYYPDSLFENLYDLGEDFEPLFNERGTLLGYAFETDFVVFKEEAFLPVPIDSLGIMTQIMLSLNYELDSIGEQLRHEITQASQSNSKEEYVFLVDPSGKVVESINGVPRYVYEFWVKLGFSILLTIVAIYIILSKKYKPIVVNWAISLLSLVAGIWISGISNLIP